MSTLKRIELPREIPAETPSSGSEVRLSGETRDHAWSARTITKGRIMARKRKEAIWRLQGPIRFALVERGGARQGSGTEASLELVLATGDRLRICAGVDGATLRTVLDSLRA